MQKKDIFHVKTKLIDIQDWEELIVVFNEEEAWEHWINEYDKVVLLYEDKEIVVNANLSNKLVKPWEIWVYQDVIQKYNIPMWIVIWVAFTQTRWEALEALKKAISGEKLNYDETYAIMKDISDNRFTDTLVTYYSAIWFFKKTTDQELYEMTKAMAETWETLRFNWIVADKHCMWGVPGNETTMIMIPLLASLGIKLPKSFSKAITSPAATGECVNVLMDISFDKKWIEKIVKKENCCLVWGGGLALAPADERLIKVAYPLSMQSYSRTVVSIMAKKHAMGINHLLLDIPVWPTAKVSDMKTARRLKRKYKYVGKKLGMKVTVALTDAFEPIGAGIGANLQVREVLRVLQQHKDRPMDLEEKSIHLSAMLIELVWMAKWKEAYDLAYKQLKSGDARKKMQSLIKTQWWKRPNIKSEEIELAKYSKDIKAEKDGIVRSIDLRQVNLTARALWAPLDDQGGLYLHKKTGEVVRKWEVIFTMYANQKKRIDLAIKNLDWKKMYDIK